MKQDDLLGPFVSIPSKDNGLDIEGLAVLQDASGRTTIYLGLRGPVLRGCAIVLELQIEPDTGNSGLLHLKKINGKSYVRHFLKLEGLGVRDLAADGDRGLLILTGPTMDLDGPIALFRWKPGNSDGDKLTKINPDGETELRKIADLPFAVGGDHAEGICVFSADGSGKNVLVVYDSPKEDVRGVDESGQKSKTDVQADLIQLP